MSDQSGRILSAVLEAAGVSLQRSEDGTAQLNPVATGCGAVFCAWCSNFVRLNREISQGEVSHTVCEPCKDKLRADIPPAAEQAAFPVEVKA